MKCMVMLTFSTDQAFINGIRILLEKNGDAVYMTFKNQNFLQPSKSTRQV